MLEGYTYKWSLTIVLVTFFQNQNIELTIHTRFLLSKNFNSL